MKKLIGVVVCIFILCACEGQPITKREGGALGGAALGAGLGAIIGYQTGNAGEGVAIGAALGGLSGGLLGNEMEKADRALEEREQRIAANDAILSQNRELIEALRKGGADVSQSKRGVVINLPDVLFEFDSARLTRGAVESSREIARVLRGVPDRHISVEGHTDSVGTYSYNERLSDGRARSVAAELVANGISRQRVSVKGLGERYPVASNLDSAGRQRNRRVEVIVENY